MGTKVSDHPRAIPHSGIGRAMEKLANGVKVCSRATPYRHQPRDT